MLSRMEKQAVAIAEELYPSLVASGMVPSPYGGWGDGKTTGCAWQMYCRGEGIDFHAPEPFDGLYELSNFELAGWPFDFKEAVAMGWDAAQDGTAGVPVWPTHSKKSYFLAGSLLYYWITGQEVPFLKEEECFAVPCVAK